MMKEIGQNSVVVGHDNRISSPDLASAFTSGLIDTGQHVILIGCVPTPALYYAAVTLGNIPGVMVTASHLGPEYNGFKLCVGARSLYGQQLEALYQMCLLVKYGHSTGFFESYDQLLSQYTNRLLLNSKKLFPMDVGIDAGNGTAGAISQQMFTALGCNVSSLYCESDGRYPNHMPNPQLEENVMELGRLVNQNGLSVGFAYDGDADRVGVVDDKGKLVPIDMLAVLISREILAARPGSKIIVDSLCSQVLINDIAEHGGLPIIWKSGHSFVKDKLLDEGALLGIELSGHLFFADDYFGFDDGIYASMRIAALLKESILPLSHMISELPIVFSSPEYRPKCSEQDKARIIRAVGEELAKKYPISDIDGIRVTFATGWGLLRPSNTEPVLSLRFEGADERDVSEYKQIFCDILENYSEVEKF
jgi:phosphomannomutase/phosphoglucomutase